MALPVQAGRGPWIARVVGTCLGLKFSLWLYQMKGIVPGPMDCDNCADMLEAQNFFMVVPNERNCALSFGGDILWLMFLLYRGGSHSVPDLCTTGHTRQKFVHKFLKFLFLLSLLGWATGLDTLHEQRCKGDSSRSSTNFLPMCERSTANPFYIKHCQCTLKHKFPSQPLTSGAHEQKFREGGRKHSGHSQAEAGGSPREKRRGIPVSVALFLSPHLGYAQFSFQIAIQN